MKINPTTNSKQITFFNRFQEPSVGTTKDQLFLVLFVQSDDDIFMQPKRNTCTFYYPSGPMTLSQVSIKELSHKLIYSFGWLMKSV
jgi:hypothetical protein